MIYLGIDPGLDGAIAMISGNLDPSVSKPPIIRAKKDRSVYDITELGILFVGLSGKPTFAVLEWVQGMPATMGGTLANYQRGYAQGLYQAMLHACKIPYVMVRPTVWQKVMLAGTPGDDTKQRSIVAAKRLFPHTSLVLAGSRKAHDGFADALLLAEYGRRTYKGDADVAAD